MFLFFFSACSSYPGRAVTARCLFVWLIGFWFLQLLRWSTQDMTELSRMKWLFKRKKGEKKKLIKFLAGPLHCSVVLFDAWLLPVTYWPERGRERYRGRERQEQRMSWGERRGWPPPSSVSRALPRGKDVLNQGFVRRHNRRPARAQGCSV